jgi:hypothetical protein
MDEISASPVVRDMFQAAIDVVDTGYRVLRSPGAEKRLGGDYTALQSMLRDLEIAMAEHSRAAEKTPSQAFAPSPTSTPASFPRSPLLGVALADDAAAGRSRSAGRKTTSWSPAARFACRTLRRREHRHSAASRRHAAGVSRPRPRCSLKPNDSTIGVFDE